MRGCTNSVDDRRRSHVSIPELDERGANVKPYPGTGYLWALDCKCYIQDTVFGRLSMQTGI